MSWNELLNTIDEEVNQNSPIIKKKQKEKVLFEKIAREVLDDRIEEIDLKGAAQTVGTAVKSGWQKLVGKIKEVAMFGFSFFGAALGKLTNGKFVLFNAAGKILTPEAEKAEFQKVAGKDLLTMTMQGKGFKIPLHISDSMNTVVGTTVLKPGVGMMYVGSSKTPGIQESIDYELNEAEPDSEEELFKLRRTIMKGIQSSEARSALSNTEKKTFKAKPVDITQGQFIEILKELMDNVAKGRTLEGGDIQTIGLYAPSGWGKTNIIKNLGEKNFNIMRLELDKVQIDMLAGFPYLADVESADEKTKKDRMEVARKVVRVAESDILPPHDAPGNWLMFFDEFNRAEAEKMAAVMNLLMSGELGNAASGGGYKLPKNVVNILAMNTQTEENLFDTMHEVKDLDIATLGRIQDIYHGRQSLVSYSANFATRPWEAIDKRGKKYYLETRIAPILLNYMLFMATKEGGLKDDAPFTEVIKVAQKQGKAEGGGGSKLTSARTWTQVTDSMHTKAVSLWDKKSDEEKAKWDKAAEELRDDIKSNKESLIDSRGKDLGKKLPVDIELYRFGAWWRDGRTQADLLTHQSAKFGDEGEDFVNSMIREYRKVAQRGISDEEVLLNYRDHRDFIKNNFSQLGFGTEAQLLARLILVIKGFKNTNTIKKLMNKRGWKIHPSGVITQIYQTIKALYGDLQFNEDDFIGFAHLVESFAKEELEVFQELHRKMAGRWDNYVESLKRKLKTKSMVEKELEGLSKKKKPKTKKKEDEKANEEVTEFLRKLGR